MNSILIPLDNLRRDLARASLVGASSHSGDYTSGVLERVVPQIKSLHAMLGGLVCKWKQEADDLVSNRIPNNNLENILVAKAIARLSEELSNVLDCEDFTPALQKQNTPLGHSLKKELDLGFAGELRKRF